MDNIVEIFAKHNMPLARMVSGSKSCYRNKYPNHEVYFNANIITKSGGKIWYGDVDITLDKETLQAIAKEIGEPLYILYEMDARFGNELLPIHRLISKARVIIPHDTK